MHVITKNSKLGVMNYEALVDLYKPEDLPACDEGMDFVKTFLETCGKAVSSPLNEEFAVMQTWRAFIRHRNGCDKCNEV